MISLEQAKALKPGQLLFHTTNTRADGSPERWRVNGKVRTWKTRPDEVRVPLKHGLYDYDYLTHTDLDSLALTEEDAIEARDHVI